MKSIYSLLLLVLVSVITSCGLFKPDGSEYVGKWSNLGDSGIVVQITQNGKNFMAEKVAGNIRKGGMFKKDAILGMWRLDENGVLTKEGAKIIYDEAQDLLIRNDWDENGANVWNKVNE